MSKKEVPVMKPVSVPSFPKCDESNRNKWISEYDKVEAELLKTHMSQPGSATVCMGLRQLPATFDRSIPPPTADEEDTPRQQRRSQSRSHSHHPPRARTTEPWAHSSSSHVGGASAAGDSPSNFRAANESPNGSPRRRPLSARASQSVSAPLSVVPKRESIHDLLRVLFTMLDTPVNFRTSFKLETDGIDLRWLLRYVTGDRTPQLSTIETIREDRLTNQAARHETAINSPRSAIVLLRNGVTVDDLQLRPQSYYDKDASLSPEAAQLASRHYEDRRRKLLQSLREEYRHLSSHVSLFDMLDEVTNFRDANRVHGNSTELVQRRKKQKEVLAASRQRMQRALEFADDLNSKAHDAEVRRAALQREREERTQQMRAEAAQRSHEANRRLEQLREQTSEVNNMITQKALDKQRRMEEKERIRQELLNQANEERRKEMEHRALIKKHKTEQHQQQVEEQKRKNDLALEIREQRAEERRQHLEAERERHRQQVKEQREKAEKARAEARRKAQEKEEEVRRRAEQRTLQAAQQLQAFERQKAREREERSALEQQRLSQRSQVAHAADDQHAKRRREIMLRREMHEREMEERDHRRQHDMELDHTMEHLNQEDKRFLVERQHRALEFRKLVSVTDITAKTTRANVLSAQRKRLMEAAWEDREALRLEKERLAKDSEHRSLQRSRTALSNTH